MDETAGDLPVRDVGLMRGGLMPTFPDTLRDVKPWKKHHVTKMKADPQRLFRYPREHLEDLCLRLQEENSVLRQHTRTQEQRLRRMSTRLIRLRQSNAGSGPVKERDMEDAIQELEARVGMLEGQKKVLQNKLSLAKQHIMDLGTRTPYRYNKVQSQRALRESQGALLEKVEELTEQLKQERQKALTLEGQLTTTTLSLQTLDKLQERILDLEGERDLIKDNYDTLLKSSLSAQNPPHAQAETQREVEHKERLGENISRPDLHQRLEEMLREEREGRITLELEKEKLRQEKEVLEEQREREEELSVVTRKKQEQLEQEVNQYREKVSSLQDSLDSITKGFDMSIEDLSETLLQIKAFRMQQESREGLGFLVPDGGVDDSSRELVNIQASHAETVLELQKTRNLLLLEHKITKDLQEELNMINQKVEKERVESRRRVAEKDKLLSKRALQINTLQAQLRELAYSPRNYKRTIPIQYTWPAGDQEVVQPIEDDLCFSQLQSGESLLEIHLKAATFTPVGLRIMSSLHPGAGQHEHIVTFCTHCLLDFEMLSTPLVSGSQPNYGFTSRYALTVRDLGRLDGQGSRVQLELHQALGGVRFITHGSGSMSLMGAMERRGERICSSVSITGNEGETIGVVDFWVRLFPPAEPINTAAEIRPDRRTVTQRSSVQIPLGWQDSGQEELHDYGGGIPNELVVMLERCVGLNARWPGLLPDAYLTYRLYDLPPHVSPMVQCSIDPVFNDVTSFPLAVTTDVLHYLRSGSLWVYVFDDSDEQIPPAYLAKTPIPLRALATGREIRGDYVLRDPAGGPRGMVRVMLKWKYPFQPPVDGLQGRWGREMVDELERATKSPPMEERRREEASQRPTAKPRVKTQDLKPKESKTVQKETKAWPQPPPVKKKSSQALRPERIMSGKTPSADRKRSTKRSSEVRTPHVTTESRPTTSFYKSPAGSSSRRSTPSSESSATDAGIQGDKLRVEILSLTFEPSSSVALERSVQRVYVEYRLLGVAMETTETPMSLRKPVSGEEIHYNFTRVIYVDGSQSAPLRRYLYTMLEGTDPNQGRLKFTVVSEPMDDEEECVDVGHAFLDLQELLLTGNDVIEQQIDIVSVDEDREVIGNLKVSLEAAKALNGIYQEFQQNAESKTAGNAEDDEKEEEEEKKEDQIQVLDYDVDDDDSVFN
ncbi:hypothetical protein CRENBAI_003344 [Crenichthys baileyi]|uniref:C2 domain-containing protein n=1 Tax=Crenichthys baileyi TaxID=28760 RepID=A0AAV9RKV2_9TELE